MNQPTTINNMAQDPKIIYKTTDPRIQKILDTDKSVNMTPGASEIESGIERNKMLTQQKNIAETSKNINDSTIVKVPIIKPSVSTSIITKLKNLFKD